MRRTLFAVVAVLAAAAGLTTYVTDAFRDAELDTVDLRFEVRGDTEPPENLVVVAIDDTTFSELRERWPFPRGIHADLVDRLADDGASTIAFDLQFTEQSDDPEQDNALIESVARAGRVVLATTEVDEHGRTAVFGGDEVLRDIGARAGHSQFPNDPGGVFRRLPYEIDRLEGFALAVAEVAKGRQIDPEDSDETAWIDFHGPPGKFETVPYSRVVNGKFARGTFRDKVVVVGPSAPSLQDLHPTSTASEDLMSGAEIQANAISTALRGFPLDGSPGTIDIPLILLLGMVGPLGALTFGPLRSILAVLAAAAIFHVGVQLAFQAGMIVSLVYPMVALGVGGVAALGVGLIVDAFERQRVRDLFARFVPRPVVDDVLAKADEELRLGGEGRTVTVLFSDIRGFTTFSETRPPDQVIEILNRYLSGMTSVILSHGGTLVSFMGDGILAVFGAPIEQPNHADRALEAAREMTGDALAEFNEWMRAEGYSDGFRMGVGLNSGPVMAGNVGSEQRLEYTVIGDTVNTASRIEGMTKGTPHMVLMADSTRAALTSEVPDLVKVQEAEVRGRQARVVLWSVAEDGAGPG